MSIACEHDQLARSCEICQLNAEIAELRAKLEKAKKALQAISEFAPEMMPTLKLSSCINLARTALGEIG